MELEQIVKVSNALSNESRFKILQSIAKNPQISCTDVIKTLDITQPAVSHHLKILNDANLIEINRKGQFGLCTLNCDVLRDYITSLQEMLQPKD